jgi:hypothetical protein
MKYTFACFLAAVVVGCAGRTPPVPLQGDPASIRALEGTWTGEYWSKETQRRGAITFSLVAGSDTAYGDVMMFAPLGQQIHAADRAEEHLVHTRMSQSLRIEFVRVGFGAVAGMLEPYVAPDCDCTVTTRFTGAVVGDTIRGTFVTHDAHGDAHDGAWLVTRQSSSAPRP